MEFCRNSLEEKVFRRSANLGMTVIMLRTHSEIFVVFEGTNLKGKKTVGKNKEYVRAIRESRGVGGGLF